MNLTKLEKASKLYEKAKQLDIDILQMEKYAEEISKCDYLVDFELAMPDDNLKEEKSAYNESMDDLSRALSVGFFLRPSPVKKEDPKNKFNRQVTPVTALRIVQMIHLDMQARRQAILAAIEELGVKI